MLGKTCARCGKPADVELSCLTCDGKGLIMPIGMYQPVPCRDCRGTGRIPLCKQDAR